MGQVFALESIRRGHVPRLQSFSEVVTRLRECLSEESSVIGAIVCGSVTRGDHTVRSDIDCFVLYDHNAERNAFMCMHELSRFAGARHVPLGFVPCDTLIASTRMHHIGASFLDHLRRSAEGGGLLKGDPLRLVVQSLPIREELESYMRVKMYNLQEAWSGSVTFSEERRIAYLKKLLEAPMHIARKVLAHSQPLQADSKVYIRSKYMEMMPSALATQFERLIQRDRWYTDCLTKHQGGCDESQYGIVIQELLDSSEETLSFIRSNLAYVAAAR